MSESACSSPRVIDPKSTTRSASDPRKTRSTATGTHSRTGRSAIAITPLCTVTAVSGRSTWLTFRISAQRTGVQTTSDVGHRHSTELLAIWATSESNWAIEGDVFERGGAKVAESPGIAEVRKDAGLDRSTGPPPRGHVDHNMLAVRPGRGPIVAEKRALAASCGISCRTEMGAWQRSRLFNPQARYSSRYDELLDLARAFEDGVAHFGPSSRFGAGL